MVPSKPKRGKEGKDSAWLFQPELIVQAADVAPVFLKRVLPTGGLSQEAPARQMIYRRQVELAVGHIVDYIIIGS